MIRFTTFALALVGFLTLAPAVHADFTVTWTHDGLDSTSTPLPNATSDLAFQIEYSIEGGPLSYVDVPAGGWTDAVTVMQQTVVVPTFCEQTIVGRVRADYRGNQGPWSAQAQDTAAACPTPGAPANMNLSIP